MKRNFVLLSIVFAMLNCISCGKIEIAPKEVQVELGTSLSQNILDYVSVDSSQEENIQKGAVLNISNINTMQVGKYEAIITYKNKVVHVPIIVEDTTAPIIVPRKKTFELGEEVCASDLADISDFSKVTAKILNRYSDGYEVEVDFVSVHLDECIWIKAIDEYGNETILEVNPEVNVPEKGMALENGEYESWMDFPYDSMKYANGEVVEMLKEEYEKIDWNVMYSKGDVNNYEYYKEKYKNFLNNNLLIFDDESGEEKTFTEYLQVPINTSLEKMFDEGGCYELYFFDMDVDSNPELCIYDRGNNELYSAYYVFKYDENKDRIVLWLKTERFYDLYGSGAIKWGDGEGNIYKKMNQDGTEACTVMFHIEGYKQDEQSGDIVYRCMMGVPQYSDDNQQVILSEEMKKYGYLDMDSEIYYFRVTLEQYDNLTADYYNALDNNYKTKEEVKYTYEEFMDLDNWTAANI